MQRSGWAWLSVKLVLFTVAVSSCGCDVVRASERVGGAEITSPVGEGDGMEGVKVGGAVMGTCKLQVFSSMGCCCCCCCLCFFCCSYSFSWFAMVRRPPVTLICILTLEKTPVREEEKKMRHRILTSKRVLNCAARTHGMGCYQPGGWHSMPGDQCTVMSIPTAVTLAPCHNLQGFHFKVQRDPYESVWMQQTVLSHHLVATREASAV